MSASDIVGVPVPADVLARALARHPRFRVQTLIGRMVRDEPQIRRTDELSIAVVDVETTGLDWRTDRVIELAVQKIGVDCHGRIVSTGKPFGWLEDPGMPIPPIISEKTNITDDMVRGRSIIEGEAYSLIATADAVLSHNAGFDRPFVEKRLGLSGQQWICSLRDIDWKEHGFERHGLEDLLRPCGLFFEKAHRATADVNALLHLLDHRLETGRTVLKELLVNAARPSWLVEARKAPFESRDLLKERGYAWAQDGGFWWRHVSDERIASERSWLEDWIYRGKGAPVARSITWKERYSARG